MVEDSGNAHFAQSRPARGAWIEINNQSRARGDNRSRPARGAWIEIKKEILYFGADSTSRPARGAWIEINVYMDGDIITRKVAPRKGRVD